MNNDGIRDNDIAIVGLALRVPGAQTSEQLWHNLSVGVESIELFSDEELLASGAVTPDMLEDPAFVRSNAIIRDSELFDADFFGLSAREAEAMDPQHRVFLELCWEALEQAGHPPDRFAGAIGVFGGASEREHSYRNWLYRNEGMLRSIGMFSMMLGNTREFMPTRVSYKLNLRGPSVNVQTACSTSLVAVHLASQSLLAGECDLALAGGITIMVPQITGYLYQEGLLASPDGRCRAFDARAGGTVWGNGGGVVCLKRAVEAIAEGNTIRAIIKGTAINNDGSAKVGYTAPSIDGQAAVVREAQAIAECHPDSIHYVEAHGAGSALGDPIEVAALTQAFRAHTHRSGYCAIGSIKTNIGHLDAAAGVVALAKTVLVLEQGQIPPSLQYRRPNPNIDFESSPFFVATDLFDWPETEQPRRAGVHSFGIGGTNAHAVLEQAPRARPSSSSRPCQLLLISARTRAALDAASTRLADQLERDTELELADVAYTLALGRTHFEHRRTITARSVAGAARQLRELGEDQHCEGSRRVAFVLPGFDADSPGLAAELFAREPVFRAALERCAAGLEAKLDLTALASGASESSAPRHALPAQFAIEFALSEQWAAWGVCPSLMIGHGLGILVAATIAGVFELEDAMRLVAELGARVQELPDFAAASSSAPLRAALVEHLARLSPSPPSIAIVNVATAERVRDEDATSPSYWAEHLLSPARPKHGLELSADDPELSWLELGPGRTLTTLIDGAPQPAALASLREGTPEAPPAQDVLLATLGQLWAAGVNVDWQASFTDERRVLVPLPTYPFQRARYWVDPAPKEHGEVENEPESIGPRADLDSWFYAPTWRPEQRRPGPRAGRHVILIDGGEDLAELLRAAGHEVEAVERVDDVSIEGPCTLVHATCLNPEFGDDALELELGCASVTRLAQLVGQTHEQDLDLIVLARAVVDVSGEDPLCPSRAAVLGAVRAIPAQVPRLDRCRLVSLGPKTPLARVLGELTPPPRPSSVIALRGHRRWVEDYTSITTDTSFQLDPGATILVTGGLGRIGLAVARDLAQRKARLVLTTRRPFPRREDWPAWLEAHIASDPVSLLIRTLMELGEVEVFSVDLSDSEQMAAVAGEIRRAFGPLKGVVHTETALGSSRARTSDLGATLASVRTLEELLEGQPLAFMVLCSSLNCALGRASTTECAVHSWLEAYVDQRSAQVPGQTLLVAWDRWQAGEQDGGARDEPTEVPLQRIEHPLFIARGSRANTEVLVAELRATDWLVDEFRVMGKAMLPGAGLIDVVHRAARFVRGEPTLELSELQFMHPLQVEEDSTIELRVVFTTSSGGPSSVRVFSRPDASWREHMRAQLRLLAPAELDVVDLAQIRERCREDIPAHADANFGLFQLGPRWQCRKWARRSGTECLALLEIDEAFRGDLDHTALHTALFDRATRASTSNVNLLPFSYASICVRAPLPAKIYSHVHALPHRGDTDQTQRFDIRLLDEQGRVLVEVDEYTLVKLDRLTRGSSEADEPSTADQGMSPQQGIESLWRALASSWPKVLVSTWDLPQLFVEDTDPTSVRAKAPVSHERGSLSVEFVAPRTEREQQLATVWSEALGVHPIGVNDNFFELGGSSLLATRVIHRLRQDYRLDIAPAAFFADPTISAVAHASITVTGGRGEQ